MCRVQAVEWLREAVVMSQPLSRAYQVLLDGLNLDKLPDDEVNSISLNFSPEKYAFSPANSSA